MGGKLSKTMLSFRMLFSKCEQMGYEWSCSLEINLSLGFELLWFPYFGTSFPVWLRTVAGRDFELSQGGPSLVCGMLQHLQVLHPSPPTSFVWPREHSPHCHRRHVGHQIVVSLIHGLQHYYINQQKNRKINYYLRSARRKEMWRWGLNVRNMYITAELRLHVMPQCFLPFFPQWFHLKARWKLAIYRGHTSLHTSHSQLVQQWHHIHFFIKLFAQSESKAKKNLFEV